MTVDLRTCKQGQKLVSSHGMILTYDKPLPEDDYYDHSVFYPNGLLGKRCHDGYTFRNNRLETDHDIVEILPMDE